MKNKKALLIIFVLTIFLIPINVFAVRQEKIIEIDGFTTFEINGVKYAVNDPEQTIEKGSTIYVDIIDENSNDFQEIFSQIDDKKIKDNYILFKLGIMKDGNEINELSNTIEFYIQSPSESGESHFIKISDFIDEFLGTVYERVTINDIEEYYYKLNTNDLSGTFGLVETDENLPSNVTNNENSSTFHFELKMSMSILILITIIIIIFIVRKRKKK